MEQIGVLVVSSTEHVGRKVGGDLVGWPHKVAVRKMGKTVPQVGGERCTTFRLVHFRFPSKHSPRARREAVAFRGDAGGRRGCTDDRESLAVPRYCRRITMDLPWIMLPP